MPNPTPERSTDVVLLQQRNVVPRKTASELISEEPGNRLDEFIRAQTSSADVAADRSKPSILIVEDKPSRTELLQLRLTDAGLDPSFTFAKDESDFTTALLSKPDIVLIDYNLAHLDVFRAMEIARGLELEIPFIVVTGDMGEEVSPERIEKGAADYESRGGLSRLPQAVGTAIRQQELHGKALRTHADVATSEAHLRSLVQNSRNVLAVVDTTRVCTYVSPAVELVTGFSAHEVVGTGGLDFVHPADADQLNQRLDELIAVTQPFAPLEVRARTKSGDLIWIEVRAVSCLDDPVIAGLVINYQDVTQRRAASQMVSDSQRSLAEAQAVSHSGSFEWDLDSDVVTWSDELFRIFGLEPGSRELDLDAVVQLIHPEDRQAFCASTSRCVEQKEGFDSKFRILRPSGESRTVHSVGQVVAAHEEGPAKLIGICQDITKRQAEQAERALLLEQQQAMGERCRLLLESTGEGIYGLDGEGQIIFINRAGAALLGYEAGELIGKISHLVLHHSHPDGSSYPSQECTVAQACTSGHGSSVEGEVFWRKDGSSFPVEYSSHPVLENGRPSGVVVSFKDVTDQDTMQSALRASEALFHGAFRAARTGIALIATDGMTYLDVNDALCEMLGYTKEELLALDWMKVSHPDDRERNDVIANEFFSGDENSYFMTKRYVRKDGETIMAEVSDALIRGPEGEPLYCVTHVSDITERNRVERELGESQALLNAVVRNSPATIYIKDRQGTCLLTNDKILESRGLRPEDVIGKTHNDIVPEDVSEMIWASDHRVFEELKPIEVEETTPHPDGSMHTYVSVKFPLFDEAGSSYAMCGISTDITERVRAEEAKLRLEAKLRQTHKMEAVGQLAGGIAHDFNNILAVIMNYAEFLAEDMDADDPRRDDVLEISKAGARAAGLVNQLLAFSRKEVIAPCVLNLNQVIEGLQQLLRRSIGEDIRFEMDLAPDLWLTKADLGQMEQVAVNLTVNARDAMPDGGLLSITTANVEARVGERVGLAAGRYATFTVKDTGAGMSEATVERIFEPFFTTKERGEGTGLGLATVYGIVKQSHGGVYAETTQGVGTSFTVYLPATEDVESPVGMPSSTQEPRASAATIIVVEDDDAVREVTSRILGKHGYEVIAMSSGPDALEFLREHPEAGDVLLTDVVMPEMSGKVLSEEVRRIRPDIKTLFMSGYTDAVIARRGVLMTGEELIKKPFDGSLLVGKIRMILGGSTDDL